MAMMKTEWGWLSSTREVCNILGSRFRIQSKVNNLLVKYYLNAKIGTYVMDFFGWYLLSVRCLESPISELCRRANC